MVTITADPTNPERLIVTQTVTMYLDKVLLCSLSAEVESAIRERAIRDLKSDKRVKKQIAAAATAKLLDMLGVPPDLPTVGKVIDAAMRSLTPAPPATTPRLTRDYPATPRPPVESIFCPTGQKD